MVVLKSNREKKRDLVGRASCPSFLMDRLELTRMNSQIKPKMPQPVILIGLQASGKSSFYLHRFFNTHVRINLDMQRTRHREKLIFEARLAAKQSVVIDNTNPTERIAHGTSDQPNPARFQYPAVI